MAANNSSMVTHAPPSLPSFAQAFSSRSLGDISTNDNSLPPIQAHLFTVEHRRVTSPVSVENRSGSHDITRKRSRNGLMANDRADTHHAPEPVHLIHVKEEEEPEIPEATPVVTTIASECADDSSPTMPQKKRRVTISGALHQLDTDVAVPNEHTCTTPISPVVMGFTIQRDNPSAIEQVKSMITIKQKQKALIEQRRGSVAVVSSPTTLTVNSTYCGSTQERGLLQTKVPPSARSARRSPNTANRRSGSSTNHIAARPSSPVSLVAASLTNSGHQQVPVPISVTSAQSFPPLPISFAKRRAEQLGTSRRKPADLLIGPREALDELQPAIQSAPPVQSSFSSTKFPMALPRLPSVIEGNDITRKVAGNVPPTPTRFSIQHNIQKAVPQPVPSISGRSPLGASVPIASTLVPPTPGFQQSFMSGDKAAFLSPFEVFYDALHDSKQLKTWLGEQLQRSNSLLQVLTQQQEKLDELVTGIVDKRVSGMQIELDDLRQRVTYLEDALQTARSQSGKVSEEDYRGVVDESAAVDGHALSAKTRDVMRQSKVSSQQGEKDRKSESIENGNNEVAQDASHLSLQPIEVSHSRQAGSHVSPPPGCLEDPNRAIPSLGRSVIFHEAGKPEPLRHETMHVEQLVPANPPRRSNSRLNSINSPLPDPPAESS